MDAEVRAARRNAVVEAQVLRQGEEAVLEPALADLLEASVLQPEQVLADHRVRVRAVDPVEPAGADSYNFV